MTPAGARRGPSTSGVPELTESLAGELRAAADRVIAGGWFVLGPELEAFEAEFATLCGAPHCVGVGSGTDALALGLRACGVGPGDEVIVPSNALPTAFGVALSGATIRFADARADDFNLDPAEVERLLGPRTRAVVPVHLYGQPADVEAVREAASGDRVAIVEDCAQAHGAPVGSAGDLAAWSFYPTKNLGALGDGGAVTTGSEELAERVRSLRVFGETERHRSAERGVNSRLDELQAALLRVKLPHLEEWTSRRREVAALYDTALAGSGAVPPPAAEPGAHARHLYPVRVADRERVRAALAEAGQETGVHYPLGGHDQPCFSEWRQGDLPVTEELCRSVLSLPVHPFVTDEQAEGIAESLLAATGAPG